MNITASHHRANVRCYHAPLLAPDENTQLRTVLYRTRLVCAAALCACGLLAALLVMSKGDVTYGAKTTDVANASAPNK